MDDDLHITAYFNFIGGQLFVSEDYVENDDSWHAAGRWSAAIVGAEPFSSKKELRIMKSALKYVEFKVRPCES